MQRQPSAGRKKAMKTGAEQCLHLGGKSGSIIV